MKKHFIALMRRVRSYAVLLTGLAVIGVVCTAFTLGRHEASTHEGGFLPASVSAVKQTAKLPDVQQPLAQRVATVATAINNCSQNSSGKLLLVSISQQHIWACDGTTTVRESAVTTGASALTNVDDATPTGTWRIYRKQTNTTLKGCDVNGCWNDPVAYWMPFDDQVGFHDASWQTFPFGSSQYKTDGSHGCVHLPADFIAWVYGWAPIGTTVTVKA
jgi:hypothetical protein